MLCHISSSGQVKRVVAPVFGHTIGRRHRPSLFGPLGVAFWVAVELHPFGSEVSEAWVVSSLWVHPGGRQLSPLHCYVDALHPAHLLHPGEGVLCIQDEDETGGVAGVLFLPQLQQLGQVEALTSCRRGGRIL